LAKSYQQLASEAAARVREIMPWELDALRARRPDLLILDVRERGEFAAARIADSLNVPRGILEAAAEWDQNETEPALVEARERPVCIVCRSGYRSAFAALALEALGYRDVCSLRLGIKGWNDNDLPVVDEAGAKIDGDIAMDLINPPLRPDQLDPRRRR
jgi:rhodanese-related sulfurtransferase